MEKYRIYFFAIKHFFTVASYPANFPHVIRFAISRLASRTFSCLLVFILKSKSIRIGLGRSAIIVLSI